MASLGALIDATEGGGSYSTLFGHSQREGRRFAGVDPSQMTIGEALQFADPSGAYGQWVKGQLAEAGLQPRVATPMGKYQIVGSTLGSAAREMGLDPGMMFDAQTQDAIAAHLAKRRLAGLDSKAAKRRAMRSEWEGFKHVDDDTLDKAIEDFEKTGRFGTEAGLGNVSLSPDGSIRRAGITGPQEEEGEDWREGALGKALGLQQGGARDRFMEKTGLSDDQMQVIGSMLETFGRGLL